MGNNRYAHVGCISISLIKGTATIGYMTIIPYEIDFGAISKYAG